MRVLESLHRKYLMLIFKWQLNKVLNRCAKKRPYGFLKNKRIVCRWIRRYEYINNENLRRGIVKRSWQKGKSVDDIEKEIS